MTIARPFVKLVMAGFLAFALFGCAAAPEQQVLAPSTKPMGDFKLGILVVYAEKVQKGPMSRDAEPEELKTAMEAEMRRRFGSIEGKKFFNIAIGIDAYVLAKPGIPLVAAPKSALIVTLNVWDDAAKKIITEEDKRFTVVEKLSGKSIMGSGMSMSREEQIQEMVFKTAETIETYLRENEALFVAK